MMAPRLLFLFVLVGASDVLARPAARAKSLTNPDLQVCFDYVQAICEGSYSPPDPEPCIRYLEFIWITSALFDCGPGDWFNTDTWSCDAAAIGNDTSASGNTTMGSTTTTNTTMPRKRQEPSTDLASAYEADISERDGVAIPLAIIRMWLKATGVNFYDYVWGCLFAQAFQDPAVKNLPLGITPASSTNSTAAGAKFAR